MHRISKFAVLVIAEMVALSSVSWANDQSAYKLVKTIDLPGKGGHGDWVTFDPETRTAWIVQSPDHNVVVIDADKLVVKAVIGGIEDGNGIAVSDKYAFVADASANKLVVIDKHSFKQIASIDTGGKKSDGVAIDSKSGNVYVANDDSNTETVFAGEAPFTRVGDIALRPQPAKDGPDVNLYVPDLDRIFQPVDNVVDVIDPNSAKVVAVWDFNLKKAAKPMVYDSQARHLIIGSRDKKMLIVDPDGKLISSIPFEGGDIDQIAVDVAARRVFIGDKIGSAEVVDLNTRQVVDHLKTEKNSHTLSVDPATHRIFVYLDSSNKVDVYEPV
jgi:DNA-binding beta-propeller fold protein YncE